MERNSKTIGVLQQDGLGTEIQAFGLRTSMQSGTTLVPTEDILVHISANVSITVDTIVLPFTLGDKIVLFKGTSYTFSADTALGIA
jgi:hypothetical protein